MNTEPEPASALITELDELERVARRLELGVDARGALLDSARSMTETFLARLASQPVYAQPDDRGHLAMDHLDPIEEGVAAPELLGLLDDQVARDGLQEVSPFFFGFIPGGGLYASAVADFVAGVLNRYTGVTFAAPAAARLERGLIDWLRREAGMPETTVGDLTSGGSIANLSATVAARDACGIRARDIERTVVYVSPLTHHSSMKALAIAGLGEAVVRVVPYDASYRFDAALLGEQISADRGAGLQPWLILCSAGATDTGSIDPLNRLADIAEAEDLWLHVDAAYGGAFVLCDEGRRRLDGLSRADSLTLDPHKGLFLPFGSGAVLVRDGRHLYVANHARGPYMQDLGESPSLETASACDLSPELSRPFRGLRLWLPLRLFGVKTFRAALAEKLLLAEYAYRRISTFEHIEVGPPPDLSIFTFRFLPPGVDANTFNRQLADDLRDDGRIYLSTTTLDGRFVLRFAVLGYNTHRAHVDTALEVIRELVLLSKP